MPTKILLLLLTLFWPTMAFSTEHILSADMALVALVEDCHETYGRTGENRIKISKNDGTLLAMKDFCSADKEHGFVIDRILWTPESNFLIFTTYSSGGHQSWHSPAFFFSRENGKILSLDELLGYVVNPYFEIMPGGNLKIQIQDKNTGKEETRTIRLDDLINKTTEPIEPQKNLQ